MAFTFRFAALIACALILPVMASAYTVVLRDGRRIEIPDRFIVSDTALTYEVKPGILVTLPLSSINVAATDVANGSPEGTLLRHAGQDFSNQSQTVQEPSPPRASRTMTNQDLEETRLRRIKSEIAYEVRRSELGLPSREESDKRRQEESLRAREILARSESDRVELENYWRRRATDLRNEIYVLDSEIDYVRARLAETNYSNSVGTFVAIGGPFYPSYIRAGQTGSAGSNQGQPIGSQDPRQIYGTVGVAPEQTRDVLRVFGANPVGLWRQRRSIRACRFTPCGQTVGFAYSYYNNSYDSSALLQHLDELLAARTGLETRWRLLEDDARRAGAQPGWLRP